MPRHTDVSQSDASLPKQERADMVLEFALVPRSTDKRRNVLHWLLASALVVVWSAIAILFDGVSGLVGVHDVVVSERATGEALVRGRAPALEGKRLLDLMNADARSMTAAEFLKKWSDTARWAWLIQESKGPNGPLR